MSLVAAPAGVLYLAWSETVSGMSSIYVKRHDANGWSLVGGGPASTAGASATLPSIAIVGGAPYVAFVEQNGTVAEIHVRRLNAGTWQRVGLPLNTDPTQNATAPSLIGIGAAPYVAFRQTQGAAQRIYVVQFP